MRKQTVKKTRKGQPAGRQGFLFYLGNALIAFSIISFIYIFAPVINTYLFPEPIKPQTALIGDYITIPKINAQAPLIFNVNPWNESEYLSRLKKGVAHAKGTALPGEKGRSFIFAHSSGNPLELTRLNTVFLKLGELKKGDIIEIKRNNKVYKYKVVDKKIVWPGEINYLKEKGGDGLIIQTCWPIGTSFKRLLVFAAPN